ncbi:beta-N-acetylhexosaminidase [Virgibacillus sp.]|uniref:beta-N-acetylhexosaminidase n=1 Tax=Virgibacillus sp. TaxID=1872700 RepID=UPI0017992358|nr:beta-N-acetylhexosaminidase [Virgibacillus sp.]NWO14534.1 beta-N-acetylhexosaminidase [Virgibacillus sp.]
MKVQFAGNVSAVYTGLKILSTELGFSIDDTNGFPIDVQQRKGSIYISKNQYSGQICFEKPIHFFRALGLWLEQYQLKQEFELVEEAQFDSSGAMLDASRNAVMRVSEMKAMLRKMAVMGLNVLMIYTEDTYEVEEYPYFGYMRGRYTEDELKACDQYAATLGIEMIPCIQTLAHLTEALKWNYAGEMKDTADILLVGEAKTYAFIEAMITAASKPFQSNRIHIGMDEAHQLGLGKYLERNGYEQRFAIMTKHLQAVVAMTEKLGLKPMLWSDMYFRLGSKTGGYYDLEAEIPDDVVASIPDVQLVYWDYYHTDQAFYQTFIKRHQVLKPNSVFAGGVWTWNGIAPNYGKAIQTTEAALTACKKEGVKEVFATMWGDNGAETPMTTALPMLQLFAKHTYHQVVHAKTWQARFACCVGANYNDFMVLHQFDETPGVSENNLHASNPSKFLLWQDILLSLYDENIKGLSLGKHYEQMIPQLTQAKERNPTFFSLFAFYEQLARVLSTKAELGIHIKQAYDTVHKENMQMYLEQIKVLQEELIELRDTHRDLWFSMNKPFGWEIIEIRYGGVITRLDTVQYRIKKWLADEIVVIEELAEDRLYFDGPYQMPAGSLGRNLYHRIVSASPL